MSFSSITRLRLVLSLICLITSLSFLTEAGAPRLLSRLELLAYDWRMTSFPSEMDVDMRIVIVDIDERSLAQEGQWPWPRQRLAQLLDILKTEYQVGAIGLDILFPETAMQPAADRTFSNSLQRNQAITAQLFQLEQSSRPLNVGKLSPGAQQLSHQLIPTTLGFIGNNSTLASNNKAGHISIDVDEDGKIRRLPPLIEWSGSVYTSLPLTLIRQLFGIDSLNLKTPGNLLAAAGTVSTPPFKLPVDQQGRMLIPFTGSAGQYLYIPAADVLDRSVEPELLQDTIVLIGSSATGLYDLISTPWSKHYPGVEVHASIISALLDDRLITEPEAANLLISILCCLLCALVLTGYAKLSITASTLLPLLLAAGWVSINYSCWHLLQFALPITLPLILLLMLALVNTPALALQATRQRQQIYRHFQDYVPRTVVEQLVRHNDQQGIQPERRELTVLFMDVRGFTSIAEQLSPSQLSELMNQVLSPVTRIIHEQGGTIDKYMGDAVMAFWGAPLEQPDHALRAVKAALEIRSAIRQLNSSLLANDFPAIRVGIGINSGNMTVGNMGSDFRVSYTVIGDAVNIAARLEGLTKKYPTDILIGSSTAAAIGSEIPCEHLGQSSVKGRKKEIDIYTPAPAQTAHGLDKHSQPGVDDCKTGNDKRGVN